MSFLAIKFPLTTKDYANSDHLARWIASVVPCFTGNVPASYTQALLKLFRDNRVPAKVVAEAFSKLLFKKMKFDSYPYDNSTITKPIESQWSVPPKNMHEVSEAEKGRSVKHTFEELEFKYTLALRTDNVASAEAVIAAALQLLWDMLKGYSKTKEAQRNIKMVEWEELNAAVDQAMERARTLQTHFRTLSREEFIRMREAPTPDAFREVTFQIANRIIIRTMPAARARRVRK